MMVKAPFLVTAENILVRGVEMALEWVFIAPVLDVYDIFCYYNSFLNSFLFKFNTGLNRIYYCGFETRTLES